MAEIVSARPTKPATRLPATSNLSTPAHRERISDASVRAGETREFSCPELWNKTIELLCDRPEALAIRPLPIADAAFAEIAAPPVTVTQDNSAGGDSHRIHVILLLEGHGTYCWEGGTVTQAPGDIIILDTAEPSQVVSPVSSRLLRLSFPETLIAPFLPVGGKRSVLYLPAREGLMTVLAHHIRELAREAERLDSNIQRGLLAHLCGLLGLAIEAEKTPRRVRNCNYRSHQRQRILTHIETHLADGRLTAGRTARDLGISPRWLHALLKDIGVSFADLVAGRRLEKCRALLEDPASNQLSIAEIAFLSGFNDLSTFYRRFGERYKTTPGEARRQAA
ncbi:helix-turn-helix domain-containing protein [Nitratireductor luteus]|uniref:helix-turn-helix domain-containing protein n=1 Tax=Nitratireductor luteus TaxID=2976980 RepID=UPI00223F619D|nr:helix-turn-helix domain-containing protein [Nitratireductor luteus]